MFLSFGERAEHPHPGKMRFWFCVPRNTELDWDPAWLLGTLMILSSWYQGISNSRAFRSVYLWHHLTTTQVLLVLVGKCPWAILILYSGVFPCMIVVLCIWSFWGLLFFKCVSIFKSQDCCPEFSHQWISTSQSCSGFHMYTSGLL